MPRSKKKKGPVKHPIGSPNWQPSHEYSTTIASLMSKERELMITRAINSGRRHGINLTLGKSNPGLGDCAFEAVIFNNNERHCFTDKLPLPIDTYRKIWVTDMANRTVNTEWNIYSTQQWYQGWGQMLIPGTYERGIFGDLMLPGIACGVKKFLLIFNTHLDSHDPIIQTQTFLLCLPIILHIMKACTHQQKKTHRQRFT